MKTPAQVLSEATPEEIRNAIDKVSPVKKGMFDDFLNNPIPQIPGVSTDRLRETLEQMKKDLGV